MPNHCETDLTITGLDAEVRAVLAKHFTAEGALDCDSVLPYPTEYKELDRFAEEWAQTHCDETGWRLKPEYEGKNLQRPKDGFNSGGYEWKSTQWGTKWGTYDGVGITIVPLKGGKIKALLGFQSAWAPPTPVLHALAAVYPQLTFRAESFEMGMGYRLLNKWEGGEQTAKCEFAYRGRRGG